MRATEKTTPGEYAQLRSGPAGFRPAHHPLAGSRFGSLANEIWQRYRQVAARTVPPEQVLRTLPRIGVIYQTYNRMRLHFAPRSDLRFDYLSPAEPAQNTRPGTVLSGTGSDSIHTRETLIVRKNRILRLVEELARRGVRLSGPAEAEPAVAKAIPATVQAEPTGAPPAFPHVYPVERLVYQQQPQIRPAAEQTQAAKEAALISQWPEPAAHIRQLQPSGPTTNLDLSQLTSEVVRMIDHHIIAQRERFGRF